MRCCMEGVAAAVGLHTSSCLMLRVVGKPVYHPCSATAVVLSVEALVQNSRHQMHYPNYGV
jgi:hypothetical protein